MSNYQEVIDLAKALTGNENLYSVQPFIKIAGDTLRGLFLERIVYWSDRSGNEGLRQLKIFYKSAEEWEDELGLSYAQVTLARKKLEEMGLIQTSKHKVKGAPTLHYYANMDVIKRAVTAYYQDKTIGYANLEKPEIQESASSEKVNIQIQESAQTIEIQESASSLNNSNNSSNNSRRKNIPSVSTEIYPGPTCQALLDICRLDWDFVKIDLKQQTALKEMTAYLAKKGAQPDDIREFDTWRKAHHWTSDSAPSLKQVGEFWGQYQGWIKQGRPSPQSNGGNGQVPPPKPSPLTPEQMAAARALNNDHQAAVAETTQRVNGLLAAGVTVAGVDVDRELRKPTRYNKPAEARG